MTRTISSLSDIEALARSWKEATPGADTTIRKPKVLGLSELLALNEPEPEMLIEGILPCPGASLMPGAPKSGKTILATQIAVAVATGRALFDNYRVLHSGPVLMIEQDDPAATASIKQIITKSPAFTKSMPFSLVPRVDFTFGEEFVAWLEHEIVSSGFRLAVLDSYTALRGPRPKGIDIVKAEQSDLRQLDDLGKRTNSAIVILHHGSKGSAGLDWSQQAAGTYAMAAATEAQVFVSRFSEFDGAAPERLVRVRSRHSEDLEMVLRFNREALSYEHVIDGSASSAFPVILQVRNAFGPRSFSPKDLAHNTGVSRATAHRQIDRLLRANVVRKLGSGEYVLVQ